MTHEASSLYNVNPVLGYHLSKACEDQFTYLVVLNNGLRIVFGSASWSANSPWILLGEIDHIVDSKGRKLDLPVPRGIQVRLSEIVLVADAPFGS